MIIDKEINKPEKKEFDELDDDSTNDFSLAPKKRSLKERKSKKKPDDYDEEDY